MYQRFAVSLAAVLFVFAAGSVANAALIVGAGQWSSGNVLPSPIIAVSGDLFETSVASTNVPEPDWGVLHNGVTSTGGDTTNYTTKASLGLGWGLHPTPGASWEFDMVSSPDGYNISEIRLFTGWSDGRTGQSYQLSYRKKNDTTFTNLGGPVHYDYGLGSFLTRTYDDGGANILTGVKSLRISLLGASNDDGALGSAYREIDVLGSAVAAVGDIPEPATMALLGLAAAGLGGYLRRRRSA